MTKKHSIDDLRLHLFDTLDALKSKENPMDLERAQMVANVSMVLIETAKAEVAMLKVAGGNGTGFIPAGAQWPLPRATVEHPAPGITVHRIRD